MGGKELVNLINSKNNASLFGRKYWIDPKITRTSQQTERIFSYFRDILKIPILRPEDFAERITREFLSNQTDKWMKKFYKYIKQFTRKALLQTSKKSHKSC